MINWHSLTMAEVLAHVQSAPHGLTSSVAAQRLQENGRNRLTPPRTRSALMRFLAQFNNTLIYVLLFAVVVTALLGHGVDSLVILGVVFINAVIGFIQEGKAEKSLEAIRSMLAPTAVVWRDDQRMEIPAEEVVLGDVLVLASGDKVCADVRLIHSRQLRLEESALTGESLAVDKNSEAVLPDSPLGDRQCMAYAGTLVTFGLGRGLVVATGDATEIGQIGQMLAKVDGVETPLLRQMAVFGRWLSVLILILASVVFAVGYGVHHNPWNEMFLAAVGLAVAAIPEGLPAIMTITLAIGVQRMAKRHAIIRQMPAVETLGSVTTICSDKTGTLTQNEMTVQKIITADRTVLVSGVGYAPMGGFAEGERALTADDCLEMTDLLRAALLCNDARIEERDGRWHIVGDPTEAALVTLALKGGLTTTLTQQDFPRLDVIPFESEHAFMASLHHAHGSSAWLYLKGAPEGVLRRCHHQRIRGEDEPINLKWWQKYTDDLAQAGYRVLAVAMAAMPAGARTISFSEVEGGLTILGLVAMIDPPREEVRESLRQCAKAGVRVKMITGDHAITAHAIAQMMGMISPESKVITGAQIQAMSQEELQAIVREVDVFARANPEHKLRLVEALQANGEITAMTGDGVNDAPSLKRADVGVAMGRQGTEAAKEAADMVLADDNFASIIAAIEEGRTVYDNLRKAIVFVLPTSIGQASMVLIAVLGGLVLPITPVQILWINMVTAVTLSLALAFEKPEEGVMCRPPRLSSEPLINQFLLWRIFFVTTLLSLSAYGVFLWALAHGQDLGAARTAAVNMLVVGQMAYLINCRALVDSVLNKEGILGNRIALGAMSVLAVLQITMTYWPLMNTLFGTAPLSALSWATILVLGLILFLLVEAEKILWSGLGRGR